MFEKLFELWHREDLLQQALKDALEMMKLAGAIFEKSVEAFLHDKSSDPQEIYDMDQRINRYEIKIRRKILEHLTISPEQDITAALVLSTITVDIERLGDFSKNFYELSEFYSGSISDVGAIEKLYANTKAMFDKTTHAFADADDTLALDVMKIHTKNVADAESIIHELLQNQKGIPSSQAVAEVLSARYFKRISAHLKNIASSVVNPFDRIGYKPTE